MVYRVRDVERRTRWSDINFTFPFECISNTARVPIIHSSGHILKVVPLTISVYHTVMDSSANFRWKKPRATWCSPSFSPVYQLCHSAKKFHSLPGCRGLPHPSFGTFLTAACATFLPSGCGKTVASPLPDLPASRRDRALSPSRVA